MEHLRQEKVGISPGWTQLDEVLPTCLAEIPLAPFDPFSLDTNRIEAEMTISLVNTVIKWLPHEIIADSSLAKQFQFPSQCLTGHISLPLIITLLSHWVQTFLICKAL